MAFPKRQPQELSQVAAQDLQAGRDIVIESINQEVNYFVNESSVEFVKREQLNEFKMPEFPNLNDNDKLIERIIEHKILMLGGSHVDKIDLAWHLSVNLQIHLDSGYSIYECYKNTDKRGLVASIDDAVGQKKLIKSATILVLTGLNPQDADLGQLQKLAQKSEIFIIATTEDPQKKWTCTDFQRKNLWIEFEKSLYSSKDLVDIALYKLDKASQLKDKVLEGEIKNNLSQVISEACPTVDHLNTFIQYLSTVNEISSTSINKAIEVAKESKDTRLSKWFNALEMREQLLVIGITMFDGLYIDQFFAALERIVNRVWQQRDASLKALDHCDLENLGNYFEFSEIARNDEFIFRRINVKDPNEKAIILRVAWESHRRQIITAIEEIVKIVKDAVHENLLEPSDWQIYGDESLRDRLYEVASISFGEIGLITPEATSSVRDLLLALASDEAFQAQNFAARVLAYWYQYKPENFLKTIQSFGTTSNKKDLYQKNKESITQKDYIGATAAIAVSYASLENLPNELDENLVNWIDNLADNTSPLVQAYFGSHTLAYVVPRHFNCIKLVLKKIAARNNNLSSSIAQSIASAYVTFPDEVLEYLESLLKENKENQNLTTKTSIKAKLTPRERILSTVVRTYGLLPHGTEKSLSIEDSFTVVQKIFQENHPIIRSAAVEAIINLFGKNPELVSPLVLKVINELTKSDRNQLVNGLTKIYLRERAELNDGEDYCEINQTRYAIWLNGERPLTAIETVMLEWLRLKSKKVAQQIATQSSIQFVDALDLQEETELTKIRKAKSLSVDQDGAWKTDNSNPWTDNWMAPAIASVATNYQMMYRASVQNILPEALENHSRHKKGTKFVLRKWMNLPSDLDQDVDSNLQLSTTARLLNRSLWISNNRFFIGLLGLAIISTGALVIYSVGSLAAVKVQEFATYRENQLIKINGMLPVDSKLGVGDVDSEKFQELKVSFVKNGVADDFLSIRDEGRNLSQIRVKGSQLLGFFLGYELIYGGRTVGSFKEGNDKTPLVISLNENANQDAINAILRNISYKSNAKIFATGERIVRYELVDKDGGMSQPFEKSIYVVTENKTPEVTVDESLSYSNIKEDGVKEYRNIIINDPDSQDISITISTQNGTIQFKEDKPKEEVAKNKLIDEKAKDNLKKENTQESKLKEEKTKEEKPKEERTKEEKLKEEKAKENKLKEEKEKEEKAKEEKAKNALKVTSNGTDKVTLKGSSEAIKSVISSKSSFTYKPKQGFYGEDSIKILVQDSGSKISNNTSLTYPEKIGDPKNTEKNFKIKVDPKDWPPSISKPETIKVDEDKSIYIGGIEIKDQDLKDPNEKMTVALSVEKGQLKIMSDVSQGLTDKDINGNNSRQVILNGSMANINKTLATSDGITYQGDKDINGVDALQISIDSDKRVSRVNVPINILPVNDPPVFSDIEYSKSTTEPTNILAPIPGVISEPRRVPVVQPENPVKIENTPPPTPTSKNTGATNATVSGTPGSKNIRSGPGVNFPSKYTVSTGERVRILESSNDSGGYTWYKVSFPDAGVEGWIAAQLLSIDGN
jgi:hypothetical protein